MARYALVALAMAFAVGMAYGADTKPKPKPTVEVKKTTGQAEGSVGSVDTQRGEQGLILTVSVNGMTYSVSPQNSNSYATVGGLKPGQKVTLTWAIEGTSERKWIKSISVVKVEPPKKPGK